MTNRIEWLDEPGSGPLAGLRVLDLSQQLPGPYSTALLASLGADVIKVEAPAGDPARDFDPEMFRRANAGKRSIRLDLKRRDDRDILLSLVERAHAFVEGFRPGVTERLGCDYDTVKAVNPAVVYCSISGFGQHGPLADRPTHDISLQAVAGALPAGARIDRIGVPWVDLATGTTAAFLIVSVCRGGAGGFIDLAMIDAAVAWANIKPQAVRELEPSYGTFATADDDVVVVALLEDAMWHRLCVALSWEDWQADPGLARYRDRRRSAPRIRARLENSLAALTHAEITELAGSHDLPIESVGADDPSARQQLLERQAGRGERATWLPLPVDWQQETDELR